MEERGVGIYKYTFRSWCMVIWLMCFISYDYWWGMVLWIWKVKWMRCFPRRHLDNKTHKAWKGQLSCSGRIRTLLGFLPIPELAKNLISISKMSGASVQTIFEKETRKMVWGVMVLLRGFWIGTLYKLLRSNIRNH
jgi:hypothetical protein